MGLSAGTVITKETKATNSRALLVVLLFGYIVCTRSLCASIPTEGTLTLKWSVRNITIGKGK